MASVTSIMNVARDVPALYSSFLFKELIIFFWLPFYFRSI